MKKTKEQEIFLMKELKIKQRMEMDEVIRLMNLSVSTVRRLFIRLEKKGLALRSHGAICLVSNPIMPSYDYEKLEIKSVSQKEKIAHYAAQFLNDKDVIYLDSGTTLAHFCNAVVHRFDMHTLSEITVFTNSLVNLNILKSAVKVNLIGGEFRNNRKDFCGYLAEEMLKKLHFTKSFLGTDGYGERVGFTATDFETARLNEIAVANAVEAIVLMDSDKLMSPSVISYARYEDISIAITDDDVDLEVLRSVQPDSAKFQIAK